jgi:eukaryotic-like serine/threonine-protein kinase
MNSPADTLAVGHLVANRFSVQKALGFGGMGCVYLCQDTLLGDKVALKILHKHLAKREDLYERFLREVRLMHKVNHQNVVRTYDVGRDGEMAYFTMEFVEGTGLDGLLESGQMDVDEAIRLFKEICLGLEAIHQCGIIHRDLKPANIMVLKDGSIKITDFGVARPESSDLTEHDSLVGTMAYMAPEIMLGKETTQLVDIYSMGVIAYLMVTGEVPFVADTPAQLVMMHVKQSPQPPCKLRPDLPSWFNRLIMKMLAKNPDERPATAENIATTIARQISDTETDEGGSSAPKKNRVRADDNKGVRPGSARGSSAARQGNTGSAITNRQAYTSQVGSRGSVARKTSVQDNLRKYWVAVAIVGVLLIAIGLWFISFLLSMFGSASMGLERFFNSF